MHTVLHRHHTVERLIEAKNPAHGLLQAHGKHARGSHTITPQDTQHTSRRLRQQTPSVFFWRIQWASSTPPREGVIHAVAIPIIGREDTFRLSILARTHTKYPHFTGAAHVGKNGILQYCCREFGSMLSIGR